MAVLPGSSEQDLVKAARDRNQSIFDCEAHAVYDSVKSSFAQWDNGYSSLQNTGTFIQVWNHVREGGLHLQHDWTVKVDADAIFIPERLRLHIGDLRAPADAAVYLKNCPSKTASTAAGFL